MSNDNIHVARSGKTIGTFGLNSLRDALISAKVLPTDHYWKAGMTDWKPVSELAGEIAALDAELRAKAAALAQAQMVAPKAPVVTVPAPVVPVPPVQQSPSPSVTPQVTRPGTVTATLGSLTQFAKDFTQSSEATRAATVAATLGSWECLTCKTGFALPIEPKSGYDTIRRAIILGVSAFGSLLIGAGLIAILSAFDLRFIAGFIGFVAVSAFLVLLFMFAFEFISSSVHHGIYRAGALKRCPGCSSNIIRKLS